MTNRKQEVLSIVVTYNGADWIEKCLSSLVNSELPTDIIVVDNASNDETCSIIRQKFPDILLIESTENLGFGKANNIGFKHLLDNSYRFAFLLNQDAWVKPNTIDKLVGALNNSPQTGMVSPMHLNDDGSKLETLFSQFIAPDKCPNLYSDIYCKSIQDKIYPCEFVNAAAWLVSINCIEQIGGFSPIFYHYGEDDNFCMRMKYHAIELGIFPNAEIHHAKNNYNSKYDSLIELEKRRKIALYSDPERYKRIDNDIYINKMSAIKSLLKFNMKDYHTFKSQTRFLKQLKVQIEPHVLTSLQKGPHFI